MALGYIERLEAFCLGFDLASERGHRRDDIRPGLRIIGFEKGITVAFMVDDVQVSILRLFSKGQDWETALLR
ncbi:type II toxin-antitoxin system RelE/ParE family toxin [Lichenifustis flavocetrariae]|uniref:type II toxin-antitoxin system RelE/ParE family toxin n=1 Tax=Lichenifustis flavocetrariae TaxID=2949735 RepID=UPI0031F4C7A8